MAGRTPVAAGQGSPAGPSTEVAPGSPSAAVTELISLGTAGPDQSTLDQVPHHLVIDRSYVHASPDVDWKRGIGLNSASTCVINSHISDFHSELQDSQAIGGF